MARRATTERDYSAFLAQLDEAITRLVAEIRNFTPPEERLTGCQDSLKSHQQRLDKLESEKETLLS
eukprot:4674381-Prorocentrum_lima.AAC.1